MDDDAGGLRFGVSEFVAVCNQTLEYAYPAVTIVGELANFRVSKNKWVYFDLKDETATVRFFGTVYHLPGPLEDGMLLAVRGMPRLHPLYGFSVQVQKMQPTGEGAIKKAALLLQEKLQAEGLFSPERKRPLAYPPRRVGLITSTESAAYRDFIKVLKARWGGVEISVIDVQVQGEAAPAHIAVAIQQAGQLPEAPDVLVITRGGGSAEDLQAFNTEKVARAVAACRIPTLVAIGHEVNISLAELAADQRASTPSNAAELLVPDRVHALARLQDARRQAHRSLVQAVAAERARFVHCVQTIEHSAHRSLQLAADRLKLQRQVLEAFNPTAALARGYALVTLGAQAVTSGRQLRAGSEVTVRLADARLAATITRVTMQKE